MSRTENQRVADETKAGVKTKSLDRELSDGELASVAAGVSIEPTAPPIEAIDLGKLPGSKP